MQAFPFRTLFFFLSIPHFSLSPPNSLSLSLSIYIYIYIYMCVCVCVCVRARACIYECIARGFMFIVEGKGHGDPSSNLDVAVCTSDCANTFG